MSELGNISNLVKGVGSCKNLTLLALSSDGLVDIHELEGLINLKNLTTLYLNHNIITDLEPLKGLVGLEVLEVEENKIEDYSVLQLLPELDEVYKDPYVAQ